MQEIYGRKYKDDQLEEIQKLSVYPCAFCVVMYVSLKSVTYLPNSVLRPDWLVVCLSVCLLRHFVAVLALRLFARLMRLRDDRDII